MGTTHEPGLQIRLKMDVQLQSSNKIATSAQEFDEYAYKFKAGTLFQNMGRAKPCKGDECSDEDCVENDGMHGWRYSEEPMAWQYCNFHAYILDYWTEYPDLFEEVEA